MSSWALFIQVALLILALFVSYYLQLKKIQAVHETVVSIFGGMSVGLIIRVAAGDYLQNLVSFDYKIFFNVLLPPIILNSGYELHQVRSVATGGAMLTYAGQLLPQHRLHPDVRLCRHFHLRLDIGHNFVPVVLCPTRGLQHLVR